MKRKARIYLAGPIGGCTKSQAHDWRDLAKNYLWKHYDLINPLDYESETPADTVKTDIKLINSSDLVLVNMWKLSPGTCMEMVYAKMMNIKVILVAPPSLLKRFWLTEHSRLHTDSLPEALKRLLQVDVFTQRYLGLDHCQVPFVNRPPEVLHAKCK